MQLYCMQLNFLKKDRKRQVIGKKLNLINWKVLLGTVTYFFIILANQNV